MAALLQGIFMNTLHSHKMKIRQSVESMELRGIEPLSESRSTMASPITASPLTFPLPAAEWQAAGFSSFIIRPHAQSFACVVSYIVEAGVLSCRWPKSDCCN